MDTRFAITATCVAFGSQLSRMLLDEARFGNGMLSGHQTVTLVSAATLSGAEAGLARHRCNERSVAERSEASRSGRELHSCAVQRNKLASVTAPSRASAARPVW